MSLEQYCSDRRLLIQSSSATAYEAARALVNQHVGAVIVQDAGQIVGILTDRDLTERVVAAELDAKRTPLRDVMSPQPFTVAIDESEERAIRLMRDRHIRRVPIAVDGKAVGIVTLDDLLMTAAIDVQAAGEIVESQLDEPAPGKPAGIPHPLRSAPAHSAGAGTSRQRGRAAAQQTLHEFKHRIRGLLAIDDADEALELFELVASALVRRVTAGEANNFVSQLPSRIREKLLDLPAGPDPSVTRQYLESQIGRRLHLPPQASADMLRRVAVILPVFVGEREMQQLVAQLPRELKEIFAVG
jgi:uncharacterized protein (DUF2267 family)/predicted transcriptional regulator